MTQRVITVEREVLASDRPSADDFRRERTAAGTLVVNLVSSPGAGKTSLLQATARHWNRRYRIAVLVGDLATDRDAQRLAPLVEAVQMTTGGACHLELPLVKRASGRLRYFAASAEAAAVRLDVMTFPSSRASGAPVEAS